MTATGKAFTGCATLFRGRIMRNPRSSDLMEHFNSAEVAAYVKAGALNHDMALAAADHVIRARLTVHLLALVALDPGIPAEQHATLVGQTFWFAPRMYRWANFVGAFQLPGNSQIAQDVVAAMDRNRSSTMYEAAEKSREHDARFGVEHASVLPFACAVSDRALRGRDWQKIPQKEHDKINAAYTKEVSLRMAPFMKRSQELACAAAPTFGKSCWYQVLADFFYAHSNAIRFLA